MSNENAQGKVLLTGAAGRVGTYLHERLGGSFDFTGIDRLPVDGLESTVANLTDHDAVLGAMQGVDAVVHLAAEPGHTPDIWWDVLLPDNIVATANVFEAARQAGVSRVVFFSSMHAVGMYERDEPWASIANGDYGDIDPTTVPLVTHEMPVRPDGPYAASKVFGESLGRYYAEEFGMTVICIRLGTMGGDDGPGPDARSRVSWLSRRDLATMVQRCIEVEGITFDIFYGASANTWKIYDTPRAWRVLGYQPQDDAESFRA